MLKKSLILLSAIAAPVLAADYFFVTSTLEAESTDLKSIQINLKPTEVSYLNFGENSTVDLKEFLELTSSKPIDSRLITWRAQGLPEGMTLSNGVLKGESSSRGLSQVAVSVSYKGKSASQTYSVHTQIPIVDFPQGRKWADGSVAKSCEEYIRPGNDDLRYSGAVGSGSYVIQPQGYGELAVHCDMETEGGGWTLAVYRNGNAATPADTFVMQLNAQYANDKDRANTTMSLNLPMLSEGMTTNDIMVVSPYHSNQPIIEVGNGRWHYETPDCNTRIGHTGKYSGCTNHTSNDHWESHDRFNIAMYGSDLPNSSSIIPYYPHTQSGGILCHPAKIDKPCEFEVYLR